ncbi:uncharacterized protein UBE2L6 isoform X1 [Gallus gallus]|uniref:uncharacterized protein UBE2L6 isoform X1 n=1 Tax=Gallus gallus TaxID=9031 RepID=UPI001F01E79F|nr:uncharacterized protein UBE2L6 isoform X1 [Gallus gallus]
MSRRLAMELEEVRRWGGVRDLQLVDRDVLRWRGLLLPVGTRGLGHGEQSPLQRGCLSLRAGLLPTLPPCAAPCHAPYRYPPPRCGPRRHRVPAHHFPRELGAPHPHHACAAGPAAAAGQPQHRAGAAPRAGPRAEREARGLPAPGRGAHPSLRRAASRHPRALSPHLGAPRPVHKAPTSLL